MDVSRVLDGYTTPHRNTFFFCCCKNANDSNGSPSPLESTTAKSWMRRSLSSASTDPPALTTAVSAMASASDATSFDLNEGTSERVSE